VEDLKLGVRVLPKAPAKLSFTYEISRSCNLRCQFCYNAWKIGKEHDTGEIATGQSLRLLNKLIDETGCGEITLSGGEPLLREDIFEVIRFIKKKKVKVGLVTNGTLLSKDMAEKCVSEGVDVFQVSLLSDQREMHNRLVGSEAFDKAIEGILNVREKKGTVYTFFVGVRENIGAFRGALELNVLLGVRNVALGRFVPGGAAMTRWQDLLPPPDMLEQALGAASEVAKRYPIAISISTPILPCLVNVSEHEHITPGFCTVGNSQHTLFAIDPVGNLKVCSHSPHILGNLFEKSFREITRAKFLKDFVETLPEYCRDCAVATICRGGCRSSAHLCYGSFEAEDPYLRVWKARADKTGPSLLKLKAMEPGKVAHER